MSSLLAVESSDLCPSNQYSLVRAIPSCFHFGEMCFCARQVSCQGVARDTRHLLGGGGGHVVYMDRGARSSSCGECDVDRLGSGSFYCPFLNQFWIASKSVCSLCEEMAGVQKRLIVRWDVSSLGRFPGFKMRMGLLHRRDTQGLPL
jgi:hypothetical protein